MLLKISLTCFSNLNKRENPRINIIVVDLVMVTLERNVTIQLYVIIPVHFNYCSKIILTKKLRLMKVPNLINQYQHH